MSTLATTTELRTMSVEDLRKEARALRTQVQSYRLKIQMDTDKDAARYRREKRQLARMLTVLTEKEKAALSGKPKTATISAPKKTSRPARKARAS